MLGCNGCSAKFAALTPRACHIHQQELVEGSSDGECCGGEKMEEDELVEEEEEVSAQSLSVRVGVRASGVSGVHLGGGYSQ